MLLWCRSGGGVVAKAVVELLNGVRVKSQGRLCPVLHPCGKVLGCLSILFLHDVSLSSLEQENVGAERNYYRVIVTCLRNRVGLLKQSWQLGDKRTVHGTTLEDKCRATHG